MKKLTVRSGQVARANDPQEAEWLVDNFYFRLCKDTGLLSGERGDLCEVAHDWVATETLSHNEVLAALHDLGFQQLVMGRDVLEVPAPSDAVRLTPGWARPPVL